jgi:probable rRNA maturation factor
MLKFQINDPKHLLPKINFKAIVKGIEGSGFFEVSIIDSKQIKALNKKYRKIDEPTDVLSFCMNDQLLGEIFIAYDYAVKEAKSHK